MAKDEINVVGEKLLGLKDGLEKMAEFADRLRISLRTATDLTKPGIHPLRMDTLDKIAAGLGTDRIGAFKMIGASDNGQEHGKPKADDFDHLSADELLALSEELKKQAAKKRGDGDGRKRKGA